MNITIIALWITLIVVILILLYEFILPSKIREGFENELISIGDSTYWSKWFPRRGDISTNTDTEQSGFRRDIRYFNGYADVQGLGVKHDFCRMVIPKGTNKSQMFFACALAGTDGLSTVSFRTPDIRSGFEVSRDDYMKDINGDGQDDYCRILKVGEGAFESRCNIAGDTKFGTLLTTDTNPPDEISQLLEFYQGVMVWLRFRDDLLDYAKNIRISTAGGLEIEEDPPNPLKTEGLIFNGIDQFLRLSDSADLSIGEKITVRYMRAVHFWIYFDEFTNNTHIFDFGNGAGKDNVWLGILGRGDSMVNTGGQIRPLLCGSPETQTIPCSPSGQQPVDEVSPVELMLNSSANVNDFSCPKPEKFGKIMPPLQTLPNIKQPSGFATLIYEIWDHRQRKLHVAVPNFFPLKKWTHVVVTTDSMDAARPNLQFWRDGQLIYEEADGHLPQSNSLSHAYLGKSNWTNNTSQIENADELLKGRIFDFRMYTTPLKANTIEKSRQWGAKKLGIKLPRTDSNTNRGPDVPCRKNPRPYELINGYSAKIDGGLDSNNHRVRPIDDSVSPPNIFKATPK